MKKEKEKETFLIKWLKRSVILISQPISLNFLVNCFYWEYF
jgi:hypothetical protein